MKIFVLLLSVFLASCATTLSRRKYDLKVISGSSLDKIEVNHEIYSLPAVIKVKRSKEDLHVKLIADTLVKHYTIRSSPSPSFVYGNLIWTATSPLAYLVDLTNQKRFYYGKLIVLNRYDTVKTLKPDLLAKIDRYFAKKYPAQKGQVNLSLSLPYVNSFCLQPVNETTKVNTGFWGLSAGLEYYYKDNRYMSLRAGAVSDFFLPAPAAVDLLGKHELMTSAYLSFTNNHKVNRFHFGYGINYARNVWELSDYGPPDPQLPPPETIEKSSKSLGFTFNVYHQVNEYFFIGLIYRPSVLRIDPVTQFRYEHLISLDFNWKIRLKK
jgi:hypothetical protein